MMHTGIHSGNKESLGSRGEAGAFPAIHAVPPAEKAGQQPHPFPGRGEDRLDFGTTRSIASALLPPAMDRLFARRDERQVRLAVTVDNGVRLVRPFLRGHRGGHFLLLPGYALPAFLLRDPGCGGDFSLMTLLTEKLKIIVGKGHPLFHKDVVTLSQLRQNRLMIPSAGSSACRYLQELAGDAGAFPDNPPLYVGNPYLICQCVVRNLAISMAAESVVAGCEAVHGLDLVEDDGIPVDLRRDILCLCHPAALTETEKEFLIAFQEANATYRGDSRDVRELWERREEDAS